MEMPDDGWLQPNRRGSSNQPRADTVCMDQVRLVILYFSPKFAHRFQKRDDVKQQVIDTPRESGLETLEWFYFYAQLECHLCEASFGWANEERLKRLAIHPRKNHKQHAFSAAYLPGVVVKKNLHRAFGVCLIVCDQRLDPTGFQLSVFRLLVESVPSRLSKRIESGGLDHEPRQIVATAQWHTAQRMQTIGPFPN